MGNFLNNCKTICLTNRTLLHGVR